jgi:hypothetical protein
MALSVLAVILKADNPLHRLTVLQRGPSRFQLLQWVVTQLRVIEGKEIEEEMMGNVNEVSDIYQPVSNFCFY